MSRHRSAGKAAERARDSMADRSRPLWYNPQSQTTFAEGLANTMADTSQLQSQQSGQILGIGLGIVGLIGVIAGIVFLPHHLGTVEIAASPIAHIGGFAITNSLLTGWISLIILALVFFLATRKMSLVPTGLQNLMELVIEALVGLAENVAGKAKGREFFALFATIFLYVVANNWLEILPGFTNSTIYVGTPPNEVPLFRSPSADLNFTIALALSAMVMVQYWGIRHTGFRSWSGKFLNFSGGPIMFIVGILELISELSRIISFSFRLFGNLFAGEVLLSVITFLLPLIFVLPFLGLELFVRSEER